MKYYSESGLELKYAKEGDAGLDLPFYDPEVETITINPGESKKLKTGIYLEIPEGTYGKIDPRSSTSKKLLTVLCSTIDSGYRGNIHIVMCNVGREPQIVTRGECLAQIIILPYIKVEPCRLSRKEELSLTERGETGFGSSTRDTRSLTL